MFTVQAVETSSPESDSEISQIFFLPSQQESDSDPIPTWFREWDKKNIGYNNYESQVQPLANKCIFLTIFH